MMLQACLNGARPANTPGLPVTDGQIARDAAAAQAAGAACLHLHPRGADGQELLAPDDVARALTAARDAAPGLPIGISTGDWIAPRLGRLQDMQRWQVRPDFVSVNLSEPDAPQVMALMREMRIGIELGLASTADLDRLLALPGDPADGAIWVMIEMDHGDLASAAPMAQAMRARLGKALPALPLLLHGFDDTAWDFIAMARDWRCDTRMGMEDCLHLPDGRPGRNAALIAAANTILTAH